MSDYNRVTATINLDAIRYNLMETRNRLQVGTKLMAIIKADGYGHGAVPIAKAVDDIADAYGVAILEEAIELREAGITKPILILGFTTSDFYGKVVKLCLAQTVYQYEMAKKLSDVALRLHKKAQIHIKVDTGMNRIGYDLSDESIADIVRISELPGIELTGIFTHFACADMEDNSFAYLQLERYLTFAKKLKELGVNIPVQHAANSAAIIEMPEANLDMVRSGISTYGLYPSQEVHQEELALRPAMELHTHIVYLKQIEAGVGVGYGCTFITKRQTKVATIPVGYADGYPRSLSNNGRVLIHGISCPIIGRICMDQFMVDVTEIEEVAEGDIVTLIGKDKEEMISVEELAEAAGSFNYEFVCNISKRVPRKYILNGKNVGSMTFHGKHMLNEEEFVL